MAEGKCHVEIVYCVVCGYLPVAVSVAAELSSINYRETAITLTPSDSGRFEVYLDGKKLYDRKEPGAVDFLPALKEIHKIRDAIKEIFANAPATTAAH